MARSSESNQVSRRTILRAGATPGAALLHRGEARGRTAPNCAEEDIMATVRTPDRARPAVRQTVLALVFAVLVALLLLGTVVGQASPPTQAGAYWPCPPRTHWECNE